MSDNAKYFKVLDDIIENNRPCLDDEGTTHLIDNRNGNIRLHSAKYRSYDSLIRRISRLHKVRLTRKDLDNLRDEIEAHAFDINTKVNPQLRVAIKDGRRVLDIGDTHNTRIRVFDGVVSVIESDDETPFILPETSLPLCIPNDIPTIDHFDALFNLSKPETLLLLAWVTYILMHPKDAGVSYPILVLYAAQGSGKTWVSNILRRLIDPRTVGVQKLPTQLDTLAVMARLAHLLIFDNVRSIKLSMADSLCMGSTGGTQSKRKLYSDSDEVISNLKVAMILNGIHYFIDQSDLAERCICFHLPQIPAGERKTEYQLSKEFDEMLPSLMAGILDLAAKTLVNLHAAEISSPERMLDFCKWLAATELALKEVNTKTYAEFPLGNLQMAYSTNLRKATADNLQDNELASALLDFSLNHGDWTGTPTELFDELVRLYGGDFSRSRYWPTTPISMSKRLKPLTTALASQGLKVIFSRGKERRITLDYRHPIKPMEVGTIYDETDEY